MNIWINIFLVALAGICFVVLFYFLYKLFPSCSVKFLQNFKHKEENEILTRRIQQTYSSRDDSSQVVQSDVKYFTNYSSEPDVECELPPKGFARAVSTDSLNSDSSVMNIETDTSPCARLELSFEYDKKTSSLTIRVLRARDIRVPSENFENYKSYVEITLEYQEEKTILKTKPVEANFDIEINQKIQFNLKDSVSESNLCFKFVTEHNSDDGLSTSEYADIKLSDAIHDQPVKFWLNLRDSKEEVHNFGEILLSLSFLPTAERLTIVIAKIAKLKWLDATTSTRESFVKVHLLKNSKRISKKKTTAKKNESSHILNECIIFHLVQEELPTIQLRFTVVEVLPDGRFYNIGHVIIGNDTIGPELTHWQQMLSTVRKPISMWHQLRKQRRTKTSISVGEDNRSLIKENKESEN